MAKVPTGDVFISFVTEAELRHGLARLPDGSRLQPLVEDFLLTVTILPRDSAAAKQYGRLRDGSLRAGLEHGGLPMANVDKRIGAHALAVGAVLVTNARACTRVKNWEVADWTKT